MQRDILFFSFLGLASQQAEKQLITERRERERVSDIRPSWQTERTMIFGNGGEIRRAKSYRNWQKLN